MSQGLLDYMVGQLEAEGIAVESLSHEDIGLISNLIDKNKRLESIVMPIGEFYSDKSTSEPCREEKRRARDYFNEKRGVRGE